MRIISLNEITPILNDKQAVIDAVKRGLIQHANGKVKLPEPIQLLFGVTEKTIKGECHIKTASSEDLPYFCIKVATGFYDNPANGLPVNDGLVILMSSATGKPLALFQDNGHMTSTRTAAAGALAASLVSPSSPKTLGIIGTGHQAELQARWISKTRVVSNIFVWGRSQSKANALKERLSNIDINVETAQSIPHLCAKSEIVVTTTPSTSPLIFASDIKRGHHIIAIGSDSPGKIELDPKILKRAEIILTDDHAQCLHHGEFGHAVKAEIIDDTKDIAFGKAIENPSFLNLNEDSVSIVDLTGLGAQDLAIASMVYDRIG